MSAALHNFSRGAALNSYVAADQVGLTDDQIRVKAPSAFAEQPHFSRSARYAYVPTVDVIAGMRREGFIPVQAQQSKARLADKQGFTKHLITFRHESVGLARVGDAIPQVLLINSHDGSSAYKLMAGLFRFICSNGLIIADGEVDAFSVPHTGDIAGRVIEGSFKVIDEAKLAGDRVESWKGIELAAPEQQAFARAAIGLRYEAQDGQPLPVTVEQVLRPQRAADQAADLWTTFNRVQENLLGGGQRYRRNGRRLSTKQVKSIDGVTSLNRALWRLADEMKALKAAA